ncbi:ArsR family transcriptional regulator [Haloarchaeobius sp. TZWWS8]|uniref:ArsR family transcriptional regulator n=1 Tax=Haloarchaeobius sp. TZWWS8 TaxID=3446121 RepID=UPI003EBE5DA3
MDDFTLREADAVILDHLQEERGTGNPWGLSTVGNVASQTPFSETSIFNRVDELEYRGYVEMVHDSSQLFEFVSDPRAE